MAKKVKAVSGDTMSRLNRISPVSNFLFNALFVALALMCFLPIIFIAIISLTDNNVIRTQGYQLWLTAETISADAYAYLWTQRQTILHALWVSIYVTAIGTCIGVALTTVMGYVLSRTEHKLNNFLTILIFIPMVFGGGMAASYVVTSQVLHLKDSIWAMILPAIMSPWSIFLMRNFMKSVPDSLYESASIDGAGDFRIFWQIFLPLAKPALATVGLFLVLGYWNQWYGAMLYIESPEKYPLQYFLQKIINQANITLLIQQGITINTQDMPSESIKMATAVVATGPIILVYPFVQKYFVSGMTVGAVKG